MNPDPLVDKVLHDTHKVVRLIGQGGMGSVYEAVHSRLRQKRFAIKVLHAKMASKDAILARFKREAEIATSLGNPHIIDVSDFYETDDGRPCMVMEYLEGEDLEAILGGATKLSKRVVIKLVEQVGIALQAVHDKGIVHRDLKPANIFLEGQDKDDIVKGNFQVKVLDFGISKMLDPDSVYTNLTSDKAVMGTPHYMSPEQGEGLISEVDHRTDIFALGTICYLMLSGNKPFNAPSLPSVIYKICHAEPPPITSHDPELPEQVNQVLLKALAKKQEDRYQRVDEFVQDFVQALTAPVSDTVAEESEEVTPQDPNSTLVEGIDAILADAFIEEPDPENDASDATSDIETEEAGGPGMTTTLSGSAAEAPVHEQAAPPRKSKLPIFIGLGVAVVALAAVGIYVGTQGSNKGVRVQKTTAKPAPTKTATVVEPVKKPVSPAPTKIGEVHPPPEPVAVEKKAAPAPPPPTKKELEAKAVSEPAATPPQAPKAIATVKPKPPRDPVVKKVRINFKLKPENAVAHINGKQHGRKPLMLRMSKRGFKVTVSARGYESKTVRVTAQASRTLAISLKKRPERKPKPKPQPKPASQTKLITDL